MGPSPHHPAPQTFKSLLFSLQSDPNNLIAEYELHREKAHEEYTTLEDYQADTLLSTLTKEEESWTDYVKWRLIELWRSGKDEDEISTLLCDEMKELGVLDDTEYVVMIGLKSWHEKRRRILVAKKEEEEEDEEILSPSVISAAGRSIRQRTSAQISPSQTVPPPPTAPSPAPDPTPVAPLQLLQHGLGEYLQQFRFALRLPIQLFLRLFFYLAVVYFLSNSLIFLLQQIPIFGPSIIFLINRIHAMILAESPAPKPLTTWLPNFNVSSNVFFGNVVFPVVSIFASSSGSNSLVEEGEGFVGPNTLFATMDNTQNLTQISLQLLPVVKILEFSSYSLLGAGSVVAASDLEFKVPMAKEYDHLVELTRAMEINLSSFSIGVEMLGKHFSLHLNVTLERIYKIVPESKATRYGVAAKDQLHEEAQRLAYEFSDLVSSMSKQVEVLLQDSHKGREQASSIQWHYQLVSQFRRKNGKLIFYDQSTSSVKAQYTPTWPEWFTGPGRSLQVDEKYDEFRLPGQWRDLKELEFIQRDADLYLSAAIDVLRNMQTDLRRLDLGAEYFEQFHLHHKSWRVLTGEMKRVEPLLARLDNLYHEHLSERQKVSEQWKDKWEYCMRQRRAVQMQMREKGEMGRGWEDCLFQT